MRRRLPVRSRLSIDARSCAKSVQKTTNALARSIGTPVLECFLAFYRFVVFITLPADDAGAMLREEVGRADNMEAPEKGCKAPEGSHDRSCCLHLPFWRIGRPLVEL